ncbi:cobyric acid synthase [Paenibacillus glycanilyticus]|uniref:Cobyric acid synthase n=1 Tax=Paenibacillus glycanilyticus TaxID=126569 RepID=A0ABQ6GJB9_9BACL|nr:cobyric acid synthase [Paenibacillus glycanilyticus]GLX70933.1 cobyric acid synthase [Paenibacillus glycanilyticus]
MLKRATTIMVQGTASDVGKSVITTALCRIFTQDGWRTAPFKSQNMALNSYVTLDGKEIGRAQGVQAEACGIAATTDMNPILIKPTGDMKAQIVVHGKPLEEMSAWRYREEYIPLAESIVVEALDRLRADYDAIVLEGAGSPAEINLKDRDIVNMRMAKWADAPVLLVADIDRGGVFASIVGTMELLEEDERRRVKGFIINKFRGDISLLQSGLDWLEERTGIPVLGVIPYVPNLDIEAEDSVVLERRAESNFNDAKELDIAVLKLPRISNFTDFDPLEAEPDVTLRYVESVNQLGQPDIMIIPGSKNSVEDLLFLRHSGLADAIATRVAEGCFLVGICGGYQMLGHKLFDPHQVESANGEADGLGFLPLFTTFYPEKRTVRVSGSVTSGHPDWLAMRGLTVEGYEIHMGQTTSQTEVHSLLTLDGQAEGTISGDGRIFGTYVHGIFHNDDFRRQYLNKVRIHNYLDPVEAILPFRSRQIDAFDRLADHVRAHLDMEKIYQIININQT